MFCTIFNFQTRSSNWYPASLVKKKFLMLTYSHIEYTWFERLMAE